MNTSTPNLDDLRPVAPTPPPPASTPKLKRPAPTASASRRPRLDAARLAQLQRTADFLRALSSKLAPFARHSRNDLRLYHADLVGTLTYLDALLTHHATRKGQPLAPAPPTAYATYLLDTCLKPPNLLPPSVSKTSRLRSRSPSHS